MSNAVVVNQIDRNLMLFLDPVGRNNDCYWNFVSDYGRLLSGAPQDVVYSFPRSAIRVYLSLLLRLFFGKHNHRSILYINDGLLSSLFDSKNSAAYQAFAERHLAKPGKIRSKIIALLPLSWRAETRYVVVYNLAVSDSGCDDKDSAELKTQNFMFFSNADGKLLLTSAETLRTGSGMIYKTTTSPDYTEVMENEFKTMRGIAEMQDGSSSLLPVGKRLQVGKRVFFSEAYIMGTSLRDTLHRLSRNNDIHEICAFLNRLDDWFEKYRATFKAAPRPLSLCYQHLYDAFSVLYAEHPRVGALLEKARETLETIVGEQVTISPITAHNDLWPGNFVVAADGLVAIDWERAVEKRAPLFDYYWMIISAAIEHHVTVIGVVDYSRAFRLFLEEGDDVTRHATEMLKTFLGRLGLDRELHQSFLLLFLMEWSVQGYLALGRQTAMDRLAFGELTNFMETRYQFPTLKH
jgi:hypothetical protein